MCRPNLGFIAIFKKSENNGFKMKVKAGVYILLAIPHPQRGEFFKIFGNSLSQTSFFLFAIEEGFQNWVGKFFKRVKDITITNPSGVRSKVVV